VYPRGIPVGVVVEEAASEGGWRRSYWLRPSVVPAAVTDAQVMLDRRGPGIEGLWLPGGDSLQPPPPGGEDGAAPTPGGTPGG